MTPKTEPNISKPSPLKPVRKSLKGTTESGRFFVNVDELIKQSQRLPLTRYVE